MKGLVRSLCLLCLLGCGSRGLDSYEEQRQALVSRDESLRFDADVEMNADELRVNKKFVALRDAMIGQYLDVGYFPPAEPFGNSKTHVEQTRLFELLRMMPKGGIHHLHGSAGIDFRWLIARAAEMENCYVFWEEDTQKFLKGEVRFYLPEAVPPGFLLAAELDKMDGFREELHDLLIFEREPSADSLKIWDEFENIFRRINGFFDYRPIFKDYTRSMVDTLRADGIHHVELRTIFRGGLYDLEHERSYFNEDTIIHILQEVEREVQQEDPDFTLRSIYTFLRFHHSDLVFEELVKAYKYKRKYPHMIVGFDLVANEDAGRSTYHFKDVWGRMDSLGTAYGTDVPLYLHDGESDWGHVKNLYDAYLLQSKRIGHGFNLMHFPSLLPAIREADICIEVNPISNQILGYVQDLRVHPANYWLKSGVQCTISSDDPGIFNYNGLSYDFWHITLAWELDLRALKKLTMNSITYSSLDEDRKRRSMAAWQKKWDAFIQRADNFLNEPNL